MILIGAVYPARRSASAAAKPAAPPPNTGTEAGGYFAVAAESGTGRGSAILSRAKIFPPISSTRQQAIGSRAGGRNAAPVRRLKQAWCKGHRMVSATLRPEANAPR